MHGFMRGTQPADLIRDHVVCTRRIRDVLITTLWISTAASSFVSAQPGTSGAITPPLSPRNANYTITARLDPAARTITGSETITWRNLTSRPATELQFHLYWNAWKNPRSTFMRELALSGSSDDEERSAGRPLAARDSVPERDRRHAAPEVLREPVLPVGEQAEREPARPAQELVHRRLPVDRHADQRRLDRQRHQRADRQAQLLALRVDRQHGDAVWESPHQIP